MPLQYSARLLEELHAEWWSRNRGDAITDWDDSWYALATHPGNVLNGFRDEHEHDHEYDRRLRPPAIAMTHLNAAMVGPVIVNHSRGRARARLLIRSLTPPAMG